MQYVDFPAALPLQAAKTKKKNSIKTVVRSAITYAGGLITRYIVLSFLFTVELGNNNSHLLKKCISLSADLLMW